MDCKQTKQCPFRNFWRKIHTGIAASPVRSVWIFVIAAALIWTWQCSYFQNILPLDVVEAISWGAQGVWGHAKHPPLSGWMAYGFSRLTGRADWGMYALAQGCIVFGLWYIFLLACRLFDPKRASIAVLSLFLVHYYNPSPMKFCTNFAEIACLPALTYYFYLALHENRWYHWILSGIFAALATLGKYSALCIVGALFVLMLCRAEDRRKWLTPGPYLAILTFFLLLAPHVHWLAVHDFCAFRYVGGELQREDHSPFFALLVIAVALYPFAVGAGALGIEFFLHRRRKITPVFQKEAFLWGVLPCAFPALPLVCMALFGKDVVMMWLSCCAMWAPLAVLAVWPVNLSRVSFRRIFYLVLAYTVVLFVALTIDVAVKARPRLHIRHEDLVSPVLQFWGGVSEQPIAAVIGDRWYANALENYINYHPVSADARDPYNVESVLQQSTGKPVLLVSGNRDRAEHYFESLESRGNARRGEIAISYRAKWGTPKTQMLYLIFLPETGSVKK